MKFFLEIDGEDACCVMAFLESVSVTETGWDKVETHGLLHGAEFIDIVAVDDASHLT